MSSIQNLVRAVRTYVKVRPVAFTFAMLVLATSEPFPSAAAPRLEVQPGDRICLVGNALGERMQHHNYWETLLYQRFPQHNLAVRNLCFPGDEPFHRLRSLNFGSPDDHLTHSKAGVILFFFGYNESFQGAGGLAQFSADLHRLIAETREKNYSGEGPPRMALISPIAFENTGDPNLPDGKLHNQRLAAYTQAMAQVAAETGVAFADVFTPTQRLFQRTDERLTLNGFHLNDAGYRALAPVLDAALFDVAAASAEPSSDGDGASDVPPPNAVAPDFRADLRAEIADKNFHWWHRYRAVNGYSIYGTRGAAGRDGSGNYNNTDVMERERAILDQMVSNRDARIWQVAQRQDVPPTVDDGNTLPFLEPTTNVGLPNDPNLKNGKLGSLDYLSAAEQKQRFKLAPGYEIQLVASEEQFPELANPVAINFDNQGRLWVATMPSYPQWKPKTELDDKLLILEDHDGDGRSDECRVFAGGLHQPTGFELGRGGVFVAQQPDILFLADTDGDDREDIRLRRLVGFDTADSHHGISAFEWGPGGALYFQEGTFKQSQIETLEGVVRLSDAGIWRYDPRTEEFEVHVSFSFANPWGHIFDRWGQNFIADASPGFNYWAAPISGYVPFPDKHPGGSRDRALDWGGPKSDKSFPTFFVKRIRPTSGCELISSRHFPPEAQGNFLLNNVIGERAVLQHRVREEGSGFAGTEIETLVSGEDGNFRPVDLQFAPDGSLYIVDWHNALIGHLQHNLRDPSRDTSHGRIWRVTYPSRPLIEPPQIAGAEIVSLLALLKEPEDRTRYRVRRELATRDSSDVLPAIEQWLANLLAAPPADGTGPEALADYEHHLLEALWMFQTHNQVHTELLQRMLSSPDHRARAAAVRVLSHWRNKVGDPLELLAPMTHDAHPRVRLEAVRACSFLKGPQAIETALEVLNYDMDVYLHYTLDETIRVLEDLRSGQSDHRLTHAQAAGATHVHDHDHNHGPATAGTTAPSPAPLVFLDKSPEIVQFQLDRMPASQLLLVERSADNSRFRPVYEAILLRDGVSRQDREEAAEALSRLNGTTVVHELLAAIKQLGDERREAEAGRREGVASRGTNGRSSAVNAGQLATILLRQPADALSEHVGAFRVQAASGNSAVRPVALAALVMISDEASAWSLAERSAADRQAFLAAVVLLPAARQRAALRDRVLDCLDQAQPLAVRRSAVRALGFVPAQPADNFRQVAPLIAVAPLRATAVQTMLRIPARQRPADAAGQVVEALVTLAESTPAAERTTDRFLEAMQLADELLAGLPTAVARGYRARLREVVVRVVSIQTVHEEMRYDTRFFAVEAGRPVQLVLRNEDLMPHNLVICAPGKLREVAQQAAGLPPTIDAQGRQYVPASDDVLHAMRMVKPHDQDVLTFTAPSEPGEYPYVCTFPNHWMRMYGVMVVVEDLDAWLSDPVEPADPLGITREYVQSWTMDAFESDVAAALQGRTPQIGERIFKEATCLQCHKLGEQGGAVGPELTAVFQRHKGDHRSILRELLDPSYKVEPAYAVSNILTVDGQVVSGIIKAQDRDTITVVSNPENPQPQVIEREEIDEIVKSSTSMMPKGLLDRFTREEIFELLVYMEANQAPATE